MCELIELHNNNYYLHRINTVIMKKEISYTNSPLQVHKMSAINY